MEISRRAPGEACLVLEDRDIIDLVQAEGSDEEFEQALHTLERLLNPAGSLPRVVVHYKEGLFAALRADCPVQAVLIEDDPHDEPPLSLQRQEVPADPAAVDAALAAVERRLRLAGRGAA
jgi:hypothetical protein